jgi:hypothetical protein
VLVCLPETFAEPRAHRSPEPRRVLCYTGRT